MTAHARPRQPSELALLVAAEARFDRTLEAARAGAAALVDAARRRAGAADTVLDGEIERERARIIAESAATLAAQRAAIAEAAGAEIVRYDAVRGDAVTAIARALATRLAAIAREDAP